MLALLDTLIGFCLIMLILSLLVKTLASVVKNRVDFYTEHLQAGWTRLTMEAARKAPPHIRKRLKAAADIPLGLLRVREELGEERVEELLHKLGLPPAYLESLAANFQLMREKVKIFFEKRMKNISLVLGLILCLGLNINGLTIFRTLYQDQDLRTRFSSPEYVEAMIKSFEKDTDPEAVEEDADLVRQKSILKEKFELFNQEVTFGVGRVWTWIGKGESTNKSPEKPGNSSSNESTDESKNETTESSAGEKTKDSIKWYEVFYEFFGSLVTAILISIGAPYWHDLLRALASLRRPKQART